MTNNSSNVSVGKPLATGGILVAPVTTAAPTNATTALNAAFKALGYVGEDGLSETIDRSTDKVHAWGGDTVRVVQSDFSVTYQFTLLETLNEDVLKTVYGVDNVTTTPATVSAGTLHAVLINSKTLPIQSFDFEIKDELSKIRIYVPKGQVIEVGDVTYVHSDVIGYPVTVEAFADTAGNQAYKYIDDGVFDEA